MLKYRGNKLIRAGFIGVVLLVLIIVVGLQPERITSFATSVRYQALFTEAGGLDVGDHVTVSGMKVGKVREVSLDNGRALVTFTVAGGVRLGSTTTAHIRTGSILGRRVLTLESSGSTAMRPSELIPVSRTSSPYSLTEALGDLTTDAAGTDTDAINHSLDTLSETLNQIAPQLGPTFEGITGLSRAVNERDQSLRDLLKSASNVTGVLSQRSGQLNRLVLNSDDLLGVLVKQRQAIVGLLASVSAAAKEISGVVHDNEPKLAATLQRLNSLAAMLEKNRDNIAKAVPGLAKFETTLGEAISGGLFYQGFIGNLAIPQFIQPFLDYLWGFRRGTNAGQPPDHAGPRAEFPFPVNGIPQPNEHWGQR
ncbi:MCE family protein [Mycobacterium paraintracellulare]|uniref:MCE family protein n=1 Tax=Mycobacterium paraintracellulare TaxID=1138383 RepID=UPI00192607FB|nr:MCE family protein [Mycobacterium paraintracellulare]